MATRFARFAFLLKPNILMFQIGLNVRSKDRFLFLGVLFREAPVVRTPCGTVLKPDVPGPTIAGWTQTWGNAGV